MVISKNSNDVVNDYSKVKEEAAKDITADILSKSVEILNSYKVAVFIVAYNAEKFLKTVIERIPEEIASLFAEIFVIDDSSNDLTYEVALNLQSQFPNYNLKAYKTPYNRGYGGNQKLGYIYSIKKNYDFVILLHGDGQYAPEYLPLIISKFSSDTDAVFASRMLEKSKALKGGMPLYKWLGNQILTFFENKLLNLNLSEFHTGFRAYNVRSLDSIPFQHNSDDFHFDTEIIIQSKARSWNIKEVSIPTFYGSEKCNVNGLKYASNCVKSVLRYHLVNLGIYYNRNFDFNLFENDNFYLKKSPYTLHQHILNNEIFSNNDASVEVGFNKGMLSNLISEKNNSHLYISFDKNQTSLTSNVVFANNEDNLFQLVQKYNKSFNTCITLDFIEHLCNPEQFLKNIFYLLKPTGRLFISTANVGYFFVRLSLLFGNFNYSKRGILDMTHKRLWTIRSFKKLLSQYGFRVISVKGFAPPFTDLISNNSFFKCIEFLHFKLSRFFPNLFAYNFLIEAERLDSVYDIFEKCINP